MALARAFGVGVLAAVAVAAAGLPGGSGGPERPGTHVVEIRRFEFVPAEVEVGPGDTIRWINRDPVPHTATASDSAWNSGRLESGEEWSHVIGDGDDGSYLCAYHPTMRGHLMER
jgi:plastocyanin